LPGREKKNSTQKGKRWGEKLGGDQENTNKTKTTKQQHKKATKGHQEKNGSQREAEGGEEGGCA